MSESQDLVDFASDEKNPILRSFKAVGGKGLAGVITALNFDWLGGGMWEVAKFGARAPKMCKVTITFSPIHDIAPGIDASGMNRAPLYPVGDTMMSMAGQADSPEDRMSFEGMKAKVDEVIAIMIDKTGILDYT
jgi:hypothetical protein